MKQFITQKEWLTIPKSVRQSLIYAFAINKSEGVRVVGGEVVSDGCSGHDLIAGLTIGKMIEFLGGNWKKVENDALFDHLLENVINKLTKKNESKESDVKNEVKEPSKEAAAGAGAKDEDAPRTRTRRASGEGKGSENKG